VSKEHKIIFKAIVGSQSYGTSTPTSDIDYKGVYMQHTDDLIGFGYKEQYEVGKDETYYELRRFLQLLQSANPTVLELLYSPDDCILEKSPVFDLLVNNRDKFLTQKCLLSFGGYAIAQIQKAKGLNKKMNWEGKKIERKTVVDFCQILNDDGVGSTPLAIWLKKEGKSAEFCGLSKIDHLRDCYCLFYDHLAEMKSTNPRFEGGTYGYNGICKEGANDVHVSSIPKGALKETLLYFNKDAYSIHCKDYKDYQTWLQNRNTQRYVDVKGHNQQIDGKNLLHCRRLLDMAIEIATHKTITVRRPNAEYLLQIRRGEHDLQSIIDKAEEDIKGLDELYKKSGLPKDCDASFVNSLLLKCRKFNPKIPPPVHLPNIPTAVICDLDGTLANLNGRSPYDASTCDEDLLNPVVADIIKGKKVVILVSGREDKFRDKTLSFLLKNGVYYDHLFMRKTGDQRNDAIIKEEIYNSEIKGKYNIELVLDDRNRVVDMWRSLGLVCHQVAYGDF